jgi:CheY-like chemotaxis protein
MSVAPPTARILIVDDDEFAREVIGSLLRRAVPHATILAAGRGEAGLQLYRSERPEVVITDLRMLGMSGGELIQAIRSEDTTTPVFAITGAPDPQPVPGATEVIQKTEFRTLIARVVELLKTPDLKAQPG